MSYAWQKALDTASEIFSSNESAVSPHPFNTSSAERSYSGFDRRHVFSMNFLWDVPFYRSQEGVLGRVLGGWQVNGLYFLSSGQRFTPSQVFNFAVLGGASYIDNTFASGFIGLDNVRPFNGNPNAPRDQVGINQVDAALIFGADVIDPRGFYSFNELNTSGEVRVVGRDDVRYIFNGPGAAQVFNTPFGDVARNVEVGPKLNNLNLGIFKNIRVTENVRIQFRTEMFNALNHPNPGVGIISGDSVPDIVIEDAGVGFNDRGEMEFARRSIQFGLRIIF